MYSSAQSLAFDSHALACPALRFLGLSYLDKARYAIPDEAYVPLTTADRRKGLAMLRRIEASGNSAPGEEDDDFGTIRRELCAILHLNRKAELQSLSIDDAVGMIGYLVDKLRGMLQ
ncbi:hypothetical protein BC938DRAFT_481871 [Jimgerdemannia flammicorona]|uniref:Topoisomerase 6 subunit A/Spo11 TOPRIM domain-containing protein n=1 Tax=Jimgerdemannia flammicorona TaxID=994334 RepID=A0A433QF48_9FUNG|nr:hypothetical protein BC938DRAFT_481871 [Jimgerdemannia flammicorona]